MLTRLTRRRALVAATAVATAIGAGAMLRADAQPAPEPIQPTDELVYVSVPPERILDTRNGNGDPRTPPGQKVGSGETINLDVRGRALAGGNTIPETAVAVMVNATITEASQPTFVTFFPTGQIRPEASTLNAVFGANSSGLGSENVPNMVTVQIGTGGSVSIFNFAGSTHVLADIAGYFVPAGATPGDLVETEAAATIDVADTPVLIGTFTAPAAGSYALNGAVDAVLDTTVGATANVECYWGDAAATPPPVFFGESLPVPSARAAFAADAQALDLAADDTVAFNCRASGLTGTVTINAVLSGILVDDPEPPPPPTTTTTTTTTTP